MSSNRYTRIYVGWHFWHHIYVGEQIYICWGTVLPNIYGVTQQIYGSQNVIQQCCPTDVWNRYIAVYMLGDMCICVGHICWGIFIYVGWHLTYICWVYLLGNIHICWVTTPIFGVCRCYTETYSTAHSHTSWPVRNCCYILLPVDYLQTGDLDMNNYIRWS